MMGLSSIDRSFDLLHAYCQAETASYQCFYRQHSTFYSYELLFSNDFAINLADFEQPLAELIEQGKAGVLIRACRMTLSAS